MVRRKEESGKGKEELPSKKPTRSNYVVDEKGGGGPPMSEEGQGRRSLKSLNIYQGGGREGKCTHYWQLRRENNREKNSWAKDDDRNQTDETKSVGKEQLGGGQAKIEIEVQPSRAPRAQREIVLRYQTSTGNRKQWE